MGFLRLYALMQIADAGQDIATQLKYLGTGNAATSMGAIELLSTGLNEGLANLSDAIRARDFD